MFHILIKHDTIWCDEGYTTTEEDAESDIVAYKNAYGDDRVRLISKEDWIKERERQQLVDAQNLEYQKCLVEDKKRAENEFKHPSLHQLRKIRQQYYERKNKKQVSNRRITRSMSKQGV